MQIFKIFYDTSSITRRGYGVRLNWVLILRLIYGKVCHENPSPSESELQGNLTLISAQKS